MNMSHLEIDQALKINEGIFVIVYNNFTFITY